MKSERDLKMFVCSPECTLERGERHLALTLATLADWSTGRGNASQARIAAAMGLGARQVRNLLASLLASSGREGCPRFEIWTRSSPEGDRLPNGYIITVPNRQPIAGALADDCLSGGTGLPGSLSTTVSGRADGYAIRTSGPEEKLVPNLPQGRTRGLTASRPGKWSKMRVNDFEPTAVQVAMAREAGLSSVEQFERFKAWHLPEEQERTQDQWRALYVGWLRKAAQNGQSHAKAVEQLKEAMARDSFDSEDVKSKAKRDRKVARAAAKVLRCSQSDLVWSDSQLAGIDEALSAK